MLFLKIMKSLPLRILIKKKFAGEILFFKAFDYFNKVCLLVRYLGMILR